MLLIRVKARKNLKKSERQLAKAQQIGRFGSWDWDIVNNEIHWSEQMCSIYGMNRMKPADI
jgi:two-component system, sensor histidine kinase and response regulator